MGRISKEMTDSERDALKQAVATHGDAVAMRTRDGRFFVIRKCTQAERVRFIGDVTPKKKNETADVAGPNKTFAISVIVFPEDQREKAEILRDYPFLCERICDRSIELSEGEAVELGND